MGQFIKISPDPSFSKRGSIRNRSCRILILGVIIIFISSASFLHGADRSIEPYRELAASEMEVILTQMTDNIQSVKNLKAEFIQERHMLMFLDVLSSKGVLYFEMPDKLRWELTEPYASILIFNNGNVAKFNLDKGKFVRMNLGMEDIFRESLRQIISIIRGDFKKVQKDYKISMALGKDYLLVMRPVSAGMAKVIKSLDLSIDRKTNFVTKIIIREPRGDSIEIRFSDQEENSSLDQRLFDLKNPLTPNLPVSTSNKGK
ncbi:MAG: outer membrane lipoprotein carrier protein LolA [Nitrospirae bacterium]|nr:outer membrane lipoprotein carrier protein LolA [Nitrospirota bacterium]